MTQVQAESIPEIIKGNDVFVKAKTGTGKTLAFLIPAIEVLIDEMVKHTKNQRASARADGVGSSSNVAPMILVLSPTRELALQITAEAKVLCAYHKLTCVTLVGKRLCDTTFLVPTVYLNTRYTQVMLQNPPTYHS